MGQNKQKQKKKHSDFESHEGRKIQDKHLRITATMIDSEAWRELGSHEIAVFLMFKHMFFKKITKETIDGELVTTKKENSQRLIITYAEAKQCLKMSGARFKKAIDMLERVGLIDVLQRSRNMKHANIYGLSDRWREYKADKPCRKWPLRRIKEGSEEEMLTGFTRVKYK